MEGRAVWAPGGITTDHSDGSPTRKTHVIEKQEKGSLWEEWRNKPPFCSLRANRESHSWHC